MALVDDSGRLRVSNRQLGLLLVGILLLMLTIGIVGVLVLN